MLTLVGRKLGQYEITERRGRGGMADVYKATHTRLQTQAAIKVLYSHLVDQEDFLARFEREARAAARLRHPNIVRVYDYDIQDELYYIVMEYIDGGSLKDRITSLAQRNQVLPTVETLQIFRQAAGAIDYAHKEGMIHRDIKTGNILLDRTGNAYLTDFGIAHIISSTHFTATGALIGTPMYMSPEQCLGKKLTGASDIYSLGMVLYEMVTGKVPFAEETPLSVIHKHVYEPLPLPSQFLEGVDPGLEKVIMKALERSPADRYPTAGEMLQALQKVVQEAGSTRTAASKPIQEQPSEVVPTIQPEKPADRTEPDMEPEEAPDGATVVDQTPFEEYEPPPIIPVVTPDETQTDQRAAFQPTFIEESTSPPSKADATEAEPVIAAASETAAEQEGEKGHQAATVFSGEAPAPAPAAQIKDGKKGKRKLNPWIIAAAVIGIAAIIIILVLTQGGGGASVACDFPEACLDQAAMYAEQGNPDIAYRYIQQMWGLLEGEEQPPSAWKWCRASEIMLSVQEYDAARDYANACILWTQGDPELEDLRAHGRDLIQIANEQQQ
jgi:serine/threonine protein kinase